MSTHVDLFTDPCIINTGKICGVFSLEVWQWISAQSLPNGSCLMVSPRNMISVLPLPLGAMLFGASVRSSFSGSLMKYSIVSDTINTVSDIINTVSDLINTVKDIINTVSDIINTVSDIINTVSDIINTVSNILSMRILHANLLVMLVKFPS